ncbi:MAG: hypothetical protein ACYDCH_10420 [Gaiellaceae bacterium]
MAHHGVWEIVFLMLILKIPIVYLALVVRYAINAKPRPEAGAAVTATLGGPDAGEGGSGHRRRRRSPARPRRPHGGPARSYPRAPLAAPARSEAERP